MKDYYEQSIRALQLAGMSERTQECYTRAVRLLVDFYKKTPPIWSLNRNWKTISFTAGMSANGHSFQRASFFV
jgi:hypothetical protein